MDDQRLHTDSGLLRWCAIAAAALMLTIIGAAIGVVAVTLSDPSHAAQCRLLGAELQNRANSRHAPNLGDAILMLGPFAPISALLIVGSIATVFVRRRVQNDGASLRRPNPRPSAVWLGAGSFASLATGIAVEMLRIRDAVETALGPVRAYDMSYALWPLLTLCMIGGTAWLVTAPTLTLLARAPIVRNLWIWLVPVAIVAATTASCTQAFITVR